MFFDVVAELLIEPRGAPTTSVRASTTSEHRPHPYNSNSAEHRPRPFELPSELLGLLRSLVASIAAKNGATTTVTTIIMTGQKARGPGNFIAND
jgi:hypothetical protein